MFLPRHFEETRTEALHELMRACPFATVVTNAGEGLDANHLPFELEGNTLLTHVARANPLAGLDGAEALVIFQGPQGYVSPNWYPTRYETGREVPTWDYAVVHVHGHVRVIDDAGWMRSFLERLTNRHEAAESRPWRMDDAPEDHIEASLRAIVGLEIDIERIVGKFKLSQNHPERNRLGVIEGLRHRDRHDDAELADLMTQREKHPS